MQNWKRLPQHYRGERKVYRLIAEFYYTTILGKTALSQFKGGGARRRLRKSQKHYQARGLKVSFQIVNLPEGNVKWIIDSDNVALLQDTEKELRQAVNLTTKQKVNDDRLELIKKRISKIPGLKKYVGMVTGAAIKEGMKQAEDMIILNIHYEKDGKKIIGVE